jgi:hypothetical protein
VLSCFSMCTKRMDKIEQPLGSIPSQGAAFAGIVNGTYTVQPSEWMVDGTNIPAGTIVYIPAGSRGALFLKNFKGTPTAPIVVINKGGKVTFSATASASYAFKTENCRYFKILGNGDPSVTYGFDIDGGNTGMTLDYLSSDFEVGYVEIRNSGFAGIMAKTDPSCDVATQRGNFTMKNISIHDNYVHKTGGEGLYVGNSFYADGINLSCGTVFPHSISNMKIYKNQLDSTGNEGIQVGSATERCEIYQNTVKNPGLNPLSAFQDNGIQIGEGTGGKCYNNVVMNAPGNGIIVLGLGDNLLYNNLIINSGGYGIFADSRYTPGPNFQFINNTIIGSALGGIKLNSETIPMNTVINNAIIQSGTGGFIIRKSTSVKLTASNNYTSGNPNELQMISYKKNNFHLLPTSPLINAGANVLLYGVAFDYYKMPRPSGSAFDIGAVEYQQ